MVQGKGGIEMGLWTCMHVLIDVSG